MRPELAVAISCRHFGRSPPHFPSEILSDGRQSSEMDTPTDDARLLNTIESVALTVLASAQRSGRMGNCRTSWTSFQNESLFAADTTSCVAKVTITAAATWYQSTRPNLCRPSIR